MRSILFALLALIAVMGWMHAARAAESYATCTNTVTALPKTISTAGNWCLKGNLATSASTHAITIATDDVTLDCNNFEISETGGAATTGIAIYSNNHFNTTIRHCNIQGFEHGIYLSSSSGTSGGGHLVEDNHLEGSTVTGIRVSGDDSIVRDNLVFDTGGSTVAGTTSTYGIYTNESVGVYDNTVMGVLGHVGANGNAYGVYSAASSAGTIDTNRLRGMVSDGTGKAVGVKVAGTGRRAVRDNDVFGNGASNTGVSCAASTARAKDNILDGFVTGRVTCGDAGDNDASH
ncbi:MAG TPA: hypothetical protein VGH80_00480 [Xanthomonadaceae bacterium]|jgi:hypothetical protein